MTAMPELKPEYIKLKRAYKNLFSQPDAQPILDDLNERFNCSPLQFKFKIDDIPSRLAFAAGAREVLLHIDNMMRFKDAPSD